MATHAHYWKITSREGGIGHGICKCGAEKDFADVIDNKVLARVSAPSLREYFPEVTPPPVRKPSARHPREVPPPAPPASPAPASPNGSLPSFPSFDGAWQPEVQVAWISSYAELYRARRGEGALVLGSLTLEEARRMLKESDEAETL